jgi:hypothetical protein
MNQKVKQLRFLEYLWLLNILKKLRFGHLLGPGSGSGPRRPDPDPTKKVRIRPDPDPQHCRLLTRGYIIRNFFNEDKFLNKTLCKPIENYKLFHVVLYSKYAFFEY